MKFVLASNNPGKLREMRTILAVLGAELVSQSEAGFEGSVQETGETFEENARLKASAVSATLGLPAIADDSGLAVEALGGAPGVHSARYGEADCTSDEDRVRLLLRNMEGLSDRKARFVSCICCVFPGGGEITARGECSGFIAEAPRGEGGFGYDPVFIPKGGALTMGEMSAEAKNKISHRSKALERFMERLAEYMMKI